MATEKITAWKIVSKTKNKNVFESMLIQGRMKLRYRFNKITKRRYSNAPIFAFRTKKLAKEFAKDMGCIKDVAVFKCVGDMEENQIRRISSRYEVSNVSSKDHYNKLIFDDIPVTGTIFLKTCRLLKI